MQRSENIVPVVRDDRSARAPAEFRATIDAVSPGSAAANGRAVGLNQPIISAPEAAFSLMGMSAWPVE
jgi:hypothetical protein